MGEQKSGIRYGVIAFKMVMKVPASMNLFLFLMQHCTEQG